MTGDDLSATETSGELVCDSDSPTPRGSVLAVLYVQVGGTLADKVLNAVYFDVFESDVFGTGRLPATAHGRILVDHEWFVASERERLESRFAD